MKIPLTKLIEKIQFNLPINPVEQSLLKLPDKLSRKHKLIITSVASIVLVSSVLFIYKDIKETNATKYIEAISLYEEGNLDKSLEKIKRNRTTKAKNLRGNIYTEQKKYDNAIKEYSSALKKDEDNPTILLNRGNTYFMEGKFDKAEADFNRVIKLDKKSDLGYLNLGVVYSNTDRLFEAIEYFNKAKKLGNKNADTYIENANLMNQEKLQKVFETGELPTGETTETAVKDKKKIDKK